MSVTGDFLLSGGGITGGKKHLHLAAMCISMASLIETNEANNWKSGQFTGVRFVS